MSTGGSDKPANGQQDEDGQRQEDCDTDGTHQDGWPEPRILNLGIPRDPSEVLVEAPPSPPPYRITSRVAKPEECAARNLTQPFDPLGRRESRCHRELSAAASSSFVGFRYAPQPPLCHMALRDRLRNDTGLERDRLDDPVAGRAIQSDSLATHRSAGSRRLVPETATHAEDRVATAI